MRTHQTRGREVVEKYTEEHMSIYALEFVHLFWDSCSGQIKNSDVLCLYFLICFFFPSRLYYALPLFVLNSFDANVVLTWFSGLLQQSWQQILLSP
jgi:hypothetical protein